MTNRNTFLIGFGLVLLFHLVQIPLMAITMMFSLSVFGLIQLAYVIPLALKAHNLGETARLQGILTAAGLTILINGVCDYNVFHNFNPH